MQRLPHTLNKLTRPLLAPLRRNFTVLSASCLGDAAFQFLQDLPPGKIGRVHSAFASALNLAFDTAPPQLVLQLRRDRLVPFGIALASALPAPFTDSLAGTPVRWSGRELEVSSSFAVAVDLAALQPTPCTVVPSSAPVKLRLETLCQAIRSHLPHRPDYSVPERPGFLNLLDALAQSSPSSFLQPSRWTPLEQRAFPQLLAIVETATQPHSKSYASSPVDLRRLIGLGAGLTPSADDAIVGLLAVLSWRRVRPPFHMPPLDELQQMTSDVSAVLLDCAGRGLCSQSILQLLRSDEGGAAAAARVLLLDDAGSTSGADALTGVLLALRAFELRSRTHRRPYDSM